MKTPYTLSTDYALLFELIQDGSVYMGIIRGPQVYTDDRPATVYKDGQSYIIQSPGNSFVKPASMKPTKEDFIQICHISNLRWIVPSNLPQSCQNCGEKVTMISAGAICPICKEEQ